MPYGKRALAPRTADEISCNARLRMLQIQISILRLDREDRSSPRVNCFAGAPQPCPELYMGAKRLR